MAQKRNDNGGMKVGAEIRRRRKALKWTLEELANRVDSDTGNLSRVETGKQGASEEMLRKIAHALGCTVADLFAGTEAAANVAPAPLGTRRIPLVSYVQAGHMTEAVDPYALGDADEWMLTDLDLSANAFALKIKGDSMLPEFREGDTVIIDPVVPPLPGDYVVAKNGENEATFKKYRPRGVNEQGHQVFELVPLNEDYPSMRSDITPIRIIGTMVEHRRYRKR
jgi:SOS-response transcriptional repressor LexA